VQRVVSHHLQVHQEEVHEPGHPGHGARRRVEARLHRDVEPLRLERLEEPDQALLVLHQRIAAAERHPAAGGPVVLAVAPDDLEDLLERRALLGRLAAAVLQGLRVLAPQTAQVAAAEEDRGSDAGPVVHAGPLDLEDAQVARALVLLGRGPSCEDREVLARRHHGLLPCSA